ncbi:hypothetical protein FACS1894109_06810 [Spirochaetia bacterium]|nr:hypothetical protein FACS1894109_06810 [Spirochaetia bacterium]
MKAYKTYTHLNEFWLNNIPQHWEQLKIKHVLTERSEKGFPKKPLLAATQNMGVVPKGVYGSRTVEATKDLHLLKLVKVGDFVISLRSFQGGIEYAYYEGIISPAYNILTPKNQNNSGYLKYLFKTIDFIELLKNCVTGIREGQNIDYLKLRDHIIPIPPISEREKIVRFLDWKVSMINTYIKAKKKQIELLKEQKQAIINQAVTKGLNPATLMKDSGIDWLGKIPEGWEVGRLKTVTRLSNEKEIGNTKVYVGLENIESWTGKYICNTETEADSACNVFYKGNLLFGKLRPYLAKTWLADFGGNCSSEFLVLSQFRIMSEYVYFLFFSKPFINNINASTYGAKMPRASWEFIGNCKIPIPSKPEQEQIINFLNGICKKCDKLLKKERAQISLLQEYRTRLISDVVTGKVDVREVKVPEVVVENKAAVEIDELIEGIRWI